MEYEFLVLLILFSCAAGLLMKSKRKPKMLLIPLIPGSKRSRPKSLILDPYSPEDAARVTAVIIAVSAYVRTDPFLGEQPEDVQQETTEDQKGKSE